VNVLGANGDFGGTANILAEVGNAEAAFTLTMAALGVNDFGIDENEFGARILLESNIDDRDAAANADLWRGQADSVRGVH